MYPGHWGNATPDRPAAIDAETGQRMTHGELNQRSIQLARLLRDRGLTSGDHLAVFMENNLRYFEVVWAALRSGLLLTPVSRHLTADEAGYIVGNCDARALITSQAMAGPAAAVADTLAGCPVRLMVDGAAGGFDAYEDELRAYSAEPLDDEQLGDFMLYSSGTTGRPKGIARPPKNRPAADGFPLAPVFSKMFRMDDQTVYLSPAPLYHSAPLGFSATVHSIGGTVVMMRAFEPRAALAAIERYRVTHSQWVPTMFSRMLKLPENERTAYDLSSQQVAIHAAAPCPRAVKEAMIAWWGPILHEYYGGTETNGITYADPEAWQSHPGTVGRPILGTLHICDEDGDEVPVGEVGKVYFELPHRPFDYYKDPDQTRAAENPRHPTWTTLGDLGRVDEDGFLYLTDRATFMIISGGVNIYPQEIEHCLALHPAVDDVAVIGVPNADLGEEVKAVVQLNEGIAPGTELEQELIAWTRGRLSHVKCPRSVDFETQLPRLPTGKLSKRTLRDRYWAGSDSRLV